MRIPKPLKIIGIAIGMVLVAIVLTGVYFAGQVMERIG